MSSAFTSWLTGAFDLFRSFRFVSVVSVVSFRFGCFGCFGRFVSFWLFFRSFRFVSVVSVVSLWLFRPFQWFRFGGFVSPFRVLVHAISRVFDKWETSSIIWEITDINLESRKYGSKSRDYRHKSGDREIRLKIWRLPDYPAELAALIQ